MKRSLISVAALAATGAACAQSQVVMFGTVDNALTYGSASGDGSTSRRQMTNGGLSSSRLGFRGQEDLGGNLTANFWLESAVFSDDGRAGGATTSGNQGVTVAAGSGLNWSRRATVGVSGDWGELRLGRDIVPSYWNLSTFDPFGALGVGTSIMVTGASSGLGAPPASFGLVPAGQGTGGPFVRASNMLAYFMPPMYGVYLQASYWLGENGQNDDGTGSSLRVGYAQGPLNVAVGWGKTEYRATPVATTPGAPSGDFTSMNVGAEWNFGWARVMGVYGTETRDSAVEAKGRGWVFGTRVPVGVGEIRASVGEYRIDGGPGEDPRTRKLALGYVHNVSKRTALYFSAARVDNDNGARVSLGGATIDAGLPDAHSTGYDLGIRHNF